jgi:hypothetical protein
MSVIPGKLGSYNIVVDEGGLERNEIGLNLAQQNEAGFTSPLGEVGAKRRVRGYALSIDLNPSPELLRNSLPMGEVGAAVPPGKG